LIQLPESLAGLLTSVAPTPAQTSQDTLTLWTAIAMLFAATIVGAVIIACVVRWFKRPQDNSAVFTLHELRNLHAEGRLTDDEFNRMKQTMLGAYAKRKSDEPTAPHVQ
jgi:hypothetical protein